MFLSAVTNTSKPARSASANKSPLVRVSHPRSLALVTVWPVRNRAMPRGVTWSKRMSIRPRGFCSRQGGRSKTASGKFQHRIDLFARHVELLDNFVYRRAGLDILKDG